jgi:hypothetical protein
MHEAIVFGMIDNGVLVIGMLLGVEFGELLLPRKYRSRAAGAAVGGFLGNVLSDAAAGLAISVGFSVGVTVGCLIPIVVMPLVVRRAGGQ